MNIDGSHAAVKAGRVITSGHPCPNVARSIRRTVALSPRRPEGEGLPLHRRNDL